MVELNIPLILDVIRTAGIIVGIIYYLSILRNQQKTRLLEMVSQRTDQANNYQYQKMVRELGKAKLEWNTPEEWYEKFTYGDNPEIAISKAVVQNNTNQWGFLFKEGIINIDFIERLYNPWHIINFWETYGVLLLIEREEMGNPKLFSDLEYLYNAIKKKYPHLSSETKFSFRRWQEKQTPTE